MKKKRPSQADSQKRHPASETQTDRPKGKSAAVDRRASAVTQRKLAETIRQSPRADTRQALGEEIDASPSIAVQRKRLQNMFGPAAQLKEGSPQNRTGLPDGLKGGVESLSGLSLDDVKTHYNSSKPAEMEALAYTQGSEIHVAPGEERHLPHEAWHIVQQKQGRVKPTMQRKGTPINDDKALEKEADVLGERAGLHRSIPFVSAPSQASSGTGVLQAVWEETDEAPATQKWTPVAGGIAWFTDGELLWYRITHLESVKPSWREDFQELEGYANRRPSADWNKTSVQPSLEWVTAINRPARFGEDHATLLKNYQTMYGKGVELWSMLTKSLTRRPEDADHTAAFGARYKTESVADSELSLTAKEAVGGQRPGFYSVSTASKGPGENNPAYSNFVDPVAGIILADSNYANKDISSPEHTGATERVPNSDILVNQFKSVGGDLANLNQIIRSNIANQDTQRILSLIERRISDRLQEKTWTPANPEFFALLGTDNVKGVAFLLSQHVHETGGKTITSIVTKGIAYIKVNLG